MAILKSQLVSAQAENKASDYSAGTVGRFWINTSTSLLKFDDGSAVRTVVTTDNTQTLTNKLLSDSTTSIVDNSDNTKVAKFECSGITTGTTRTYTWIDANGTILSTDTPTTTKGDILAHSTKLVRVAIGTDGQVLTADSASTPGLKWATPATAPDQSYEISNVAIANSVGASALTIDLKDKSGSDPSAGSPCKIGFRSATAATGTYVQRSVTSAVTITVPSTATMGWGSATTNYLYVYAIDNAGTVELAVSGKIFDDGSILSTTVLNTSSDSSSVIYSTTARTGVAIRLIARLKFTLTTAGTWDEVADEISLQPFFTRKTEYHAILGDSPNGHGATNTKIRRWTNVSTEGTALTYADSANNGMSVTVNESGIYSLSYTDGYSAGGTQHGWSINSTQLTTNIESIATANRAIMTQNPGANLFSNCSVTVRLAAGSVIRTHTAGANDGAGAFQQFAIIKTAD